MDFSYGEGWLTVYIPMMACHQVRPSGIRALPVRKVAMLQLTSSPIGYVRNRFYGLNVAEMYSDIKTYNSCGKLENSMCVSRSRSGASRHSVRVKQDKSVPEIERTRVRCFSEGERDGEHTIHREPWGSSMRFSSDFTSIMKSNGRNRGNRENCGRKE